MKVVVCVKASAATEPAISNGRLDESTLKLILSEWDLQVLEMLVRIREEGLASEVVAVTAGDARADAVLRQALAQGADRAIRVQADAAILDPLAAARLLAVAVRDEAPDLVVTGLQSSDLANCITGGALAAVLGWPCATCVISITGGGPGTLRVRRQLLSSIVEVRDVDVPAVLTVQAGFTPARYPNFRAIAKAAKADIPVLTPTEASVAHAQPVGISPRERQAAAQLFEGSTEEIARAIAAVVGVNLP